MLWLSRETLAPLMSYVSVNSPSVTCFFSLFLQLFLKFEKGKKNLHGDLQLLKIIQNRTSEVRVNQAKQINLAGLC